MKRSIQVVIAAIGALAVVTAARWLFLFFIYVTPPVTLTIPDVTKEWKYTHGVRQSTIHDASLRVNVTGTIDGDADIIVESTETVAAWTSAIPKRVHSGPVKYQMTEPEWWCRTAFVSYRPINVSSGSLTVTIDIH